MEIDNSLANGVFPAFVCIPKISALISTVFGFTRGITAFCYLLSFVQGQMTKKS